MVDKVRLVAASGSLGADVGDQGRPELGGHQAVEDEVGGAVDQGDDLQDLSKWNITRVEELGAEDRGEHSQNSLQMLKHYALYYNFGNMNRNRQISILRDP